MPSQTTYANLAYIIWPTTTCCTLNTTFCETEPSSPKMASDKILDLQPSDYIYCIPVSVHNPLRSMVMAHEICPKNSTLTRP